ncbi:hypothetical protein EIP91_006379 [Steccherinum ochraceum]|uniref:Uncharacterized protein n=1 Tax=Steccherinum ochraceum TaxID=92696 RepID=A0A4R0R8J0_9APHY|nr:hypothetical protein EIP91_006379 [Steccherinum ochraceum]
MADDTRSGWPLTDLFNTFFVLPFHSSDLDDLLQRQDYRLFYGPQAAPGGLSSLWLLYAKKDILICLLWFLLSSASYSLILIRISFFNTFELTPECLLGMPFELLFLGVCGFVVLRLHIDLLRLSVTHVAALPGLYSLSPANLRRVRGARRDAYHRFFQVDSMAHRSPGSAYWGPVLSHSLRRLSVSFNGLCHVVREGRCKLVRPEETLSKLLQGTLELDGIKLRPTTGLSDLLVFAHSAWMCLTKNKTGETKEPREYLIFSPDGSLQPKQTLDGVPPKLLEPVLRALLSTICAEKASVTLQCTTRGRALPPWYKSDLFCLVSLVLHYPVRDPCHAKHRVWRSDPTPSAGKATQGYLPLFNTPDRVVDILAAASFRTEPRNVTQQYVETLRGWADRLDDAAIQSSRKSQLQATEYQKYRRWPLQRDLRAEICHTNWMVAVLQAGLLERWEVEVTSKGV